jgi:hypothetical protein
VRQRFPSKIAELEASSSIPDDIGIDFA